MDRTRLSVDIVRSLPRASGMEDRPWTHPSMSLEELLRHAGAFLDMLLLASGYQSTGALAFWSRESVEVALSWALFLENAMEELADKESRLALDEALTSLMDSTPHPPGLPNLSVAVLMEARVLLLRVLLQAMGSESGHIASVVGAVAKVSADSPPGGSRRSDEVPNVAAFVDGTESMPTKLSRHLDGKVVSEKREDSSKLQSIRDISRLSADCFNLWSAVQREASSRCSATIHVNVLARAVETAAELNCPVKETPTVSIWRNEEHAHDGIVRQTSSSACMPLRNIQEVVEPWRQNGLSYLMSANTNYKLSGALIIFSGSKVQWTQVFDALRNKDGAKAKEDDGCLTELAVQLLSSVKVTSICHREYNENVSVTVKQELCCMYLGFKQWKDVCLRLLDPSSSGCSSACQQLLSKLTESELLRAEKQVEIESYFVELTAMNHDIWWTLAPILLAIAVTASSRLLNLYTESLLSHMVQASSARCRHHACCTAPVSERTWCLSIAHGVDRSIRNEKLQTLLTSVYDSTHTKNKEQAQNP